MAGESAGGTVISGGPIYYGLDVATGGWWSKTFGLGGSDSPEKPQFAKLAYVRQVPGFTEARWEDPQQRILLLAESARRLLADPGSSVSRNPRSREAALAAIEAARRLLDYLAMQQRIRETRSTPEWLAKTARRISRGDAPARIVRAFRRAGGTMQALPGPPPTPGVPQPGGDIPLPTIPATGEPEPAWLELLRIIFEQLAKYREQRAARELERAQRRALKMSLADSFGNVLSSVATAAPAVLQTYYNAKAAEQAAKSQLQLARLGAGFAQSPNYSGVPLAGPSLPALTGGALGMLLGEEPGVLEGGGVLERLGLEGDLERTATLWKRSGAGFRAIPSITARHPTSGSLNTWVSMGRPVLYTGDLAACKRVNKIASRVARVARTRAFSGVRRRRRR